jgi:hypothetical protein
MGTVKDLEQFAMQQGLRGYSRLPKAELIDLLSQRRSPAERVTVNSMKMSQISMYLL